MGHELSKRRVKPRPTTVVRGYIIRIKKKWRTLWSARIKNARQCASGDSWNVC